MSHTQPSSSKQVDSVDMNQLRQQLNTSDDQICQMSSQL